MAENGYLTQDMHDQFWKTLRRTADNTEQDAFIEILAPAVEWGQEYQLELWKSARLSYLEGQVNKTLSLVEMQNNLEAKFQEWISKASQMPDYHKMLQDTKRGLQASLENGEVLLEAAAEHDPMPFPNAPSLRLDKEYIDRIIDRIDDSFSRVQNLLDPEWRD